MNFNNPFELLNSSNINNLNFHENIDKTIITYIDDLISKQKNFNDLDYFCNNRLKDYELPTHINKKNVSTNFFLDLHGSAKGKRGVIKIPENVYVIALEHNGITWSNDNISYLLERMKIQNIFNESFLKAIVTEISLLELFQLKTGLNHKSINDILNDRSLYIQKYYKVYNPNNNIDNFILQSDEKNAFYTGLYKLPTKSYIAYQKNEENKEEINESWTLVKSKSKFKSNSRLFNVSKSINETWKVISHTKIKNALFNPESEYNQDIIKKLIYPNNNNLRIEQNDYYTLHLNYLKRFKSNPKFRARLESMYTLKEDLNINVTNGTNKNKSKVLSFKNLLKKVIDKVKPTSNKPLILFCNFCTSNDKIYYPQYSFIKKENSPEFLTIISENKNENNEDNENNKLKYLNYEKYVLKNRELTLDDYNENIQRMIFDIIMCENIYNVYFNKINSKILRIKKRYNENIYEKIKDDVILYLELINEENKNMKEIKECEKRINDFYKSTNITNFYKKMEIYKSNLYKIFEENNQHLINILCSDILHETKRLFTLFNKTNIYYNSKKIYFKQIRYFYNTFYPSSYFFTGNCTNSHSFLQYVLFIVYAHTRKTIKSLVYNTFENTTFNNSNHSNIKLKDDYISRIIDIHYKHKNKKISIIFGYDRIMYNVIYDLHKIYTNNNIHFGVHKRQHKALMSDLNEYYNLYLKDKNIYKYIGNVKNDYLNIQNMFENKNYTKSDLKEIRKRSRNKYKNNNFPLLSWL